LALAEVEAFCCCSAFVCAASVIASICAVWFRFRLRNPPRWPGGPPPGLRLADCCPWGDRISRAKSALTGALPTSRSRWAIPNAIMFTSTFHVPLGRSSSYWPFSSVVVVILRSPRRAVTDAPGIGRPADRTVPVTCVVGAAVCADEIAGGIASEMRTHRYLTACRTALLTILRALRDGRKLRRAPGLILQAT